MEGEVIPFKRPPQGSATSVTSPPVSGRAAPELRGPEQLRVQLDTLTHHMGTALGRLGRLPPGVIDPQYRRNLLEQYAELSDFAAQLYERLDTEGAQPGQTLGITGEVDKFQTDVGLFVSAIESELARVIGPTATGPQPYSSNPNGKVAWWYWAAGGAVIAGGLWLLLSQRGDPIPAR